MLKHKHIAVIGGDQRSIHMIEYLAGKSANILAVGFNDVSFTHQNVKKCSIESVPFHTLDTTILPVHGMDKKFTVDQYFPPDQIKLTEKMLAQMPEDSLIFSGTANHHLRKLCAHIGRELIVLYELEHIAILNALPTAEATLQLAMKHTQRIIQNQKVLITGFGRVSQAIAQLFQTVGAHVHIAARKQTDLATANIRSFDALHIDQLNKIVPTINICINTVPHLMFTDELIKQMSQETLIIDVASMPGGTDFSAAKKHGIQAIHALGLPGKTAPITAGEIIAKPIIKRLLN